MNTTVKVMPILGLTHPSARSNEGADAPIPIVCLIVWSCEFEGIENIVFHENYLANYVEKLQ